MIAKQEVQQQQQRIATVSRQTLCKSGAHNRYRKQQLWSYNSRLAKPNENERKNNKHTNKTQQIAKSKKIRDERETKNNTQYIIRLAHTNHIRRTVCNVSFVYMASKSHASENSKSIEIGRNERPSLVDIFSSIVNTAECACVFQVA